MKLAIITLTPNGVELAQKISVGLGSTASIYARRGHGTECNVYVYDSLTKLLEEAYPLYEGLIFVMSTGIVVRAIATYVKDKKFTPSIVVLDENGENVISLLSGYFGGANELAKKIAQTVKARPIITTSVEINRPTVDYFANKLYLTIEPIEKLRQINAAIINGENVNFFVDKTLVCADAYYQKAQEIGISLHDAEKVNKNEENCEACVIVTDKIMPQFKDKLIVYLRPTTIVLSVIAKKGIDIKDVLTAISQACNHIKRSIYSVRLINVYKMKVVEMGILAAARKLGVPIEYLDGSVLQGKDLFHENANFEKLCEKNFLIKNKMKILLPCFNYENKVKVFIAEITEKKMIYRGV